MAKHNSSPNSLANLTNKGRPKGALNKTKLPLVKAKLSLAEAIREKVTDQLEAIMQELVRIALEGETEASRIGAIRELIDRGWGKAPQHIAVKAEHTVVTTMDVQKLSPGERETLYKLIMAATPDAD